MCHIELDIRLTIPSEFFFGRNSSCSIVTLHCRWLGLQSLNSVWIDVPFLSSFVVNKHQSSSSLGKKLS